MFGWGSKEALPRWRTEAMILRTLPETQHGLSTGCESDCDQTLLRCVCCPCRVVAGRCDPCQWPQYVRCWPSERCPTQLAPLLATRPCEDRRHYGPDHLDARVACLSLGFSDSFCAFNCCDSLEAIDGRGAWAWLCTC